MSETTTQPEISAEEAAELIAARNAYHRHHRDTATFARTERAYLSISNKLIERYGIKAVRRAIAAAEAR